MARRRRRRRPSIWVGTISQRVIEIDLFSEAGGGHPYLTANDGEAPFRVPSRPSRVALTLSRRGRTLYKSRSESTLRDRTRKAAGSYARVEALRGCRAPQRFGEPCAWRCRSRSASRPRLLKGHIQALLDRISRDLFYIRLRLVLRRREDGE